MSASLKGCIIEHTFQFICNCEGSAGRKSVESGIKTKARVNLQLNWCLFKSTTPVLNGYFFNT